jgi:glyoxylase-like metal-dependent hydrolase (beta-lactamase superfamily II)
MSGLSVIQVTVEGFDKNFSYLIVDEKTKKALLVDPCGNIERVFKQAEGKELTVVGVLITHTHFDHHERLGDALLKYDVPVYLHEDGSGRTLAEADREELLEDKDTISFGKHTIQTFNTPGHLDDCVCYYIQKEDAADGIPKLITGDTLFVEGCGRTTEVGVGALYESLQFLKTFPDETEVYTGHDYGSVPVSTIAHEKEHNKYFLAKDFEEFKKIRLPGS